MKSHLKSLQNAKRIKKVIEKNDTITKQNKNIVQKVYDHISDLKSVKMDANSLKKKNVLKKIGKKIIKSQSSMDQLEKKIIILGNQLEKKKNISKKQSGGYFSLSSFLASILSFFYWWIRTLFFSFFRLLGREVCLILANVFVGIPLSALTAGIASIPITATNLIILNLGFSTLMFNDMLKNGMTERQGASILTAVKLKQAEIVKSKGELPDNTTINFMEMKVYSNKWGVITRKKNTEDGLFNIFKTKIEEYIELTRNANTLYEKNIANHMNVIMILNCFAALGVGIPFLRYYYFKNFDQLIGYQVAQYIDDEKYPQFREEYLNCIITVWGRSKKIEDKECNTFRMMVKDIKKLHRTENSKLFNRYDKKDKFGLTENDWLLIMNVKGKKN